MEQEAPLPSSNPIGVRAKLKTIHEKCLYNS